MPTRWKGVSHHRSMFSPQLAVLLSFPGLATGSQPQSTSLVWQNKPHESTDRNKKSKVTDPTLLRVCLGEFLSPAYHMDSKCARGCGDTGKGKGQSSSSCGSWNMNPEPLLPWIAWQPCNGSHRTLCTFTRAFLDFHQRSSSGYGSWKLS